MEWNERIAIEHFAGFLCHMAIAGFDVLSINLVHLQKQAVQVTDKELIMIFEGFFAVLMEKYK